MTEKTINEQIKILESRWSALRENEQQAALEVMENHELGGNFLAWIEAYSGAEWFAREKFQAAALAKTKQNSPCDSCGAKIYWPKINP